MKYFFRLLVAVSVTAAGFSAHAAETTETALSCSDFNPTEEAIERYPDLIGACEAVVERDGELYGRFKTVVRRVGVRNVTLYLPATDHTFTVRPEAGKRLNVGGRMMRPENLMPGQELSIYLSVSELATPDIEEIALVTDEELIISHPVTIVTALPTTASLLPALGGAGILLVAAGLVTRRLRIKNRS